MTTGRPRQVRVDHSSCARTQLNRDTYDFELVGYEPSRTGGQYVLRVSPKSRSKYVYRGKVWVDGNDFAVTRIEGEPAQNPSFWTKKSEIHHEYKKVQGFWLPIRNESVTYIRWEDHHPDHRVQGLSRDRCPPAREALTVLSSGDSNP